MYDVITAAIEIAISQDLPDDALPELISSHACYLARVDRDQCQDAIAD
jgi:hypothetical protein